MRTSKKRRADPAAELRLRELIAEVNRTQADLALAYRQFDLASDPELVESCIYLIDALKARYNYLIRTVKAHQAQQKEAVAAASAGGKRQWI